MRISNIETILNLNQLGYTNRFIGNYLNINHRTVYYWLKKFNFSSSWANQKINIVSKVRAKCSKCNKIKSLIEFQHGRKGQKYQYKFSYCNECRKKTSLFKFK